ncbi:hypothetical protein AB1Y20_018297 [Prymnesium parvum]|uniref:Uncharacterized protein n=1 Tax=Prymnesium parvum TaxID=97485 RepID=A0AB34JNF9_PRYPA
MARTQAALSYRADACLYHYTVEAEDAEAAARRWTGSSVAHHRAELRRLVSPRMDGSKEALVVRILARSNCAEAGEDEDENNEDDDEADEGNEDGEGDEGSEDGEDDEGGEDGEDDEGGEDGEGDEDGEDEDSEEEDLEKHEFEHLNLAIKPMREACAGYVGTLPIVAAGCRLACIPCGVR